jgi:hypothetical protein
MRLASRLPGIVTVMAALLAAAYLPAPAQASESVTLQTSFSPDRLGASTTIGFSFQIASSDGGAPSPLTSVALHLPRGINYLSSTLGLAICQPAALIARGIAGCPPDSLLGSGSAFVEVPFGASAGYEIPDIQALMGPPHNGNVVVLFYANGREPVYAQIVFQGELIAGSATLGGSLNAAVPLIPSVNGGPPVSILSVHTTIGPEHLTYYEHVNGRMVSFHPHGVDVPLRCPRGGFRFSADFSFMDATNVTATSTVPCPRRR